MMVFLKEMNYVIFVNIVFWGGDLWLALTTNTEAKICNIVTSRGCSNQARIVD